MIDAPTSTTSVSASSSERTSGGQGLMIVDDHELVRWGLRALVQSQSHLTSQSVQVFEACTLTDALALFAANHADIDLVFFDPGLPDTEGLSGLSAFLEQYPAASVVVLSGDANTQTAAHAMALGARAYLKKTGDLTEVIDYLQSHGFMDASDTHPKASSSPTTYQEKERELSARQGRILQWILQGKSNREIGELESLAEGTVKNHVSTLLLHFGAKSRAQLISTLR